MKEMIAAMQRFTPISPVLNAYLQKHLHTVALHKKEIFIDPQHSSPCLSFVKKGILKSYQLKNGSEASFRFSAESGWIINHLDEYQPGYYCQAIEPSLILSLTLNRQEALLARFPQLNHFLRKIFSSQLVEAEQIASILRCKNTRDRYHTFQRLHPEIFSRIPSRYLASFLNISEGTISRIRGGRS